MKTNYLNRIPAKYRNAVMDFYKDADGWWILLDHGGDFIFDGYYCEYTIHEDTQAEALAAFRLFITKK